MTVREFLARSVSVHLTRFRRGGPAAIWWAVRLTAAAVAAYVVALGAYPGTEPLLAPLTALLVVQFTPISLLASGLDRVVSVVAGVSVAVAFSEVVPLAWWSLGLLIAVSILIGQVLRLGSNLVEVPISAMLVLGVGSLGAESAAWQRSAETLIGAAVGVLSNLLFPPKVGTDDAGRALKDLADDLARLLDRAADEMANLDYSGRGVGVLAGDWLDQARRTTHEIPRVGRALERAEQGRRLNVRALGTPNAGPGLRQGMEALEHSAVAVRSMFRAINDATNEPDWPVGEVGEAVMVAVEAVCRDIAAALSAFGALVRADAQPHNGPLTSEIAEVEQGLEGLMEARARISDVLLMSNSPVLSELHVSLLTTVRRLLRELNLQERIQRERRLQPPVPSLVPPMLARAAHRVPADAEVEEPVVEPEDQSPAEQPRLGWMRPRRGWKRPSAPWNQPSLRWKRPSLRWKRPSRH